MKTVLLYCSQLSFVVRLAYSIIAGANWATILVTPDGGVLLFLNAVAAGITTAIVIVPPVWRVTHREKNG